MARKVARIGLFLFSVVLLIPLNAWGENTHITLLYSNNINGQVYASG